MGLVQRAIGWILALAILAMFPWLLLPALTYWAWRKGALKCALRRVRGWAKEGGFGGLVARVDASVATRLSSNEVAFRYESPCEDSPYIVVERGGEKRMLIASSLKGEAGAKGDYGAVVASIMALLGGLSWSITFSFFISGDGEVGGLIALDRPAPENWMDLRAVNREAMGQIKAVERAVEAVAPSLSVRSLRGKELAPLALWGAFS